MNEPHFIKIYDCTAISKLTPLEFKILMYMLNYVTYTRFNGSRINLNRGVKKDICKAIGIKNTHTIDNYIKKIADKGIIRRIDAGIYEINPLIVAKGRWEDIEITIDKY